MIHITEDFWQAFTNDLSLGILLGTVPVPPLVEKERRFTCPAGVLVLRHAAETVSSLHVYGIEYPLPSESDRMLCYTASKCAGLAPKARTFLGEMGVDTASLDKLLGPPEGSGDL